jgi:hypothetical protein
MKAKLFIGLAVATVAIAAATIFAVNHFSPKSQMSDLTRANLEALTNNENAPSYCEQEFLNNYWHVTKCNDGWGNEVWRPLLWTEQWDCMPSGPATGKCLEKYIEHQLDCRGIIYASTTIYEETVDC